MRAPDPGTLDPGIRSEVGGAAAEGGPVARWLGIEVVSGEPGRAVLRMPTRWEMADAAGTLDAGFVALLAGSAMSRALAAALPEGWDHGGFDLKTNLIEPGRIGEALVAVARVLHTGRRTGVAECRVEAEGERLLATATATFIVHLPESQS